MFPDLHCEPDFEILEAKLRILITDITEMSAGNFCIAGWCAAEGRMIRPLLPGGARWTKDLLTCYGISPLVTLEINPVRERPTGAFPHLTEDTNINRTITVAQGETVNWPNRNAPQSAATVDAAFGNNVHRGRVWDDMQKAHVAVGTQTASLSAIAINSNNLEFFEADGKLRVRLNDGAHIYNLPVVSHGLRSLFSSDGLAAVKRFLPANRNIHVRLGLARAWEGQPDKCFVMVNGIYW